MIVANPLVSADWLKERLHQPGLVLLDCSWYLPMHQRDAKAEFVNAHIEGAQFFDIDAVSDPVSTLPHMLPTPQAFAEAVGKMGISNTSTIVLYDGMGLLSSPRVWWTFLVFGARDVHILDGGLPAWIAKFYSLTQALVAPVAANFTPEFNSALVAGMDEVSGASQSGEQIVDARPAGRFSGADPEFRVGLRSGHMPGAFNVPQGSLIKDGHFRQPQELLAIFEKAGVDLNAPTITSCGSGLTAASLTLSLAVLGKPLGKLYDGSWTEWASHPENPIETTES